MGGRQGLEPRSGMRCNAEWMRAFAAALLLGLLFAGAAQAKLNPAFSERVAEPGDTVVLDVGEGSEQFLGPLRIYLVPLEAAAPLPRSSESAVTRESDPRLVKIGELGTPGEFGTPPLLTFKVPDLPDGEYTIAIWFKGYETGTWANALEGIHPLLTIGAADASAASPARADERTGPPLWAVALAVSGLVAFLVAFGWRRTTRRAATGASPS